MSVHDRSKIPSEFYGEILLDDVVLSMAKLNDVDEIIAIELDSHKNPWGKQSFIDVINHKSNYIHLITARSNNKKDLVGYICFQYLLGELYLVNVTISKPWRKRGYATKILSFLIDRFKAHGCERVILDVDPENTPAIKLYTKLGFKFVNDTQKVTRIMSLELA